MPIQYVVLKPYCMATTGVQCGLPYRITSGGVVVFYNGGGQEYENTLNSSRIMRVCAYRYARLRIPVFSRYTRVTPRDVPLYPQVAVRRLQYAGCGTRVAVRRLQYAGCSLQCALQRCAQQSGRSKVGRDVCSQVNSVLLVLNLRSSQMDAAPLVPVAGPSQQLEFQIINVSPLVDGMLSSVFRQCTAEQLAATERANTNTGVLVYGRTLDGRSVHVQLEMPTSFVVQIPQEWTSPQVKKLADALGVLKYRIQMRTRFVYYTPHLYGNKDRDSPQKLKYARLFFSRHSDAHGAYWKYSAEDGFRKGCRHDNSQWASLLQAADLPSSPDWRDWHMFSVHDLSDPVRDFFTEVDQKLKLSTDDENHASLESWIMLAQGIQWEPTHMFFARSSMNATISIGQIERVSNTLAAAPMTKISFDIEQYSVLNPLTQTRPFPRFWRITDEIRNISCAIKHGGEPMRTVALCVGATALPKKDGGPGSEGPGHGDGFGRGGGGGGGGDLGEALLDQAVPFPSVVVQPGERRAVPGTDIELRVYAREDEMLVAFGQLMVDEECDLLTGYNIINYDEAAVFSRLYMYHLCKSMPYRDLAAIYAVAKEKMARYGAIRAAHPKLTQEVREQIADLFALHAPTYELTKDAPLVYVILAQVQHFDEKAYAYFVGGVPVLSWFYHGKIPTQMVSYREHMYDTSAAGQFMMKQWTGTNSAILCAWVMLKRSQYRLTDYSLRGVLMYFFRDKAEFHKLDLPIDVMHNHMESQHPDRLWEVAMYCCRDAAAVLFLHDKLCTEENMRQSGALLRTPMDIQADCGMQRLLMNMMFAELETDYIINRFQPDVFEYEGAVVIEPIAGFYTDPVRFPCRTHIIICRAHNMPHSHMPPSCVRPGSHDGLPVVVPKHHDRGEPVHKHDAAEAARRQAPGRGRRSGGPDVGV